MSKRVLVVVVAALLVAFGVSETVAAQSAPAVLPMQGFLADGDGAPVDRDVDLAISLYVSDVGDSPLYRETQSVVVDAGHFTAYIGEGAASIGDPFDLALFRDNSTVWVGIAIDAGTELPRFQLGSVPYAAVAEYANVATNATQLNGAPATDYALRTQAQAPITGACGAGEAIASINADGSVGCRSTGGITGGACPAGQAITGINAAGVITCAPFGVTGVSGAAASGITGGGTSGAVVLNTDPTIIQRRVTATCPAGQAIQAISQTGTVTCQAVPSYTAGAGLTLTGSTFSIGAGAVTSAMHAYGVPMRMSFFPNAPAPSCGTPAVGGNTFGSTTSTTDQYIGNLFYSEVNDDLGLRHDYTRARLQVHCRGSGVFELVSECSTVLATITCSFGSRPWTASSAEFDPGPDGSWNLRVRATGGTLEWASPAVILY